MYWNAEQRCRKFTRNMVAFFIIYDQIPYVTVICYSIYCICIGNMDTSTWPTVYDFNLPIDDTSIGGWYISLILVLLGDISYILSMTSATTYFVSSCFYISAAADHFERLMHFVQQNVEFNLLATNPRTQRKRGAEIKKQVHKAIKIHVDIYE